jgi:hypothetical protein
MRDRFPILGTEETIPWSAIAPHEDQAQHNHSQSLATLAQRGGLSWGEAYHVLRNQGLPWPKPLMSDAAAKPLVLAIIAAKENKQKPVRNVLEISLPALSRPKSVTHTLTLVPVASGAGRGECSCGWRSRVSDDGQMSSPDFYTADNIRADWREHAGLPREEGPDVVPVARSLLDSLVDLLATGNFSTGCCMCGSPVDSHGMESGHSPVDEGSYYADMIRGELLKLLPAAQPSKTDKEF